MKNRITITIDGQSVEIKKLPLGKYAELLRAVKELPKIIGLIDGNSTEEIVRKIPEIVATSLPDVINILTIATPLKREFMESDDFGLYDAVAAISAVIEVNNYKGIFDNIKKLTASQSEKKV